MSENGSENTNTRDAAERYLRAGLAVIPVPAGEKNPNRPGWQNERWEVKDVPRLWNNGQGIGILWGEPSGGLVDVDMDWPEARSAARHILPATRTFGRPGAPESHRVYRVTGTIPKSKKYKLPGDGPDRCVVEFLSTGAQSLAPPSLHDSGERREWYREQPADEVDCETMMEGVADVATAALVARNWPGQGARHDFALAASGYIGRRLPRGRAERVMKAAIAASGDEEATGRLANLRSTLDNLAGGVAVTGGPTLDELAPGIVGQLQRWHSWGNERSTDHTTRSEQAPGPFRLTDLGNAERFVQEHGHRIRWCAPWAKWLCFDGTRWITDDTGEVERLMKGTVRGIYAEAAQAQDSQERKAIADHAKRSESAKRITDALRLVRSEPGIPILPDQLDADPWLLNVQNGIIDLRTGELRDHRREDLITKLAPVEYDPNAQAPTFKEFLARILPSEALRSFVQRAIGYATAGVVSEEVLVILYGVGANGKSTLVNIIMETLGDYAIQAAPDLLLAKRSSHPTELADLLGARFVASVETDEGRRLAEGLVKQLTGRDPIKARRMREDFWQFDPTHTVFLATNHRPEVKGTDHAIWRRLKLAPFEVTIPEAKQDKKLPEKLHAELPGILAWIVEGCLQWQRNGLGESEEVKAATTSYRDDMDVLAGFIEDRCVVNPDVQVKFSSLYASYQDWCDEAGEKAESKRRFGTRLKERGFEPERGTGNAPIRRGIGIRDDHHPDPEGRSRVTREPESYPTVTRSNPYRYGESDEGSYRSYPKSDMGGGNSSRGELYANEGNYGNYGNYGNSDELPNTPRGGRLTEDQEQRYRKLIREGLQPEWARKTVLAGGHPLDCECAVCA